MTLKVQIISLFFSFLYGMFFSFLLSLTYKIIYNNNKIIRVLSSFFFIIFNSLFYFYILLKINNGIIHIYLFFSLIIGYITEQFIYNKIALKIKKWYNHLSVRWLYEKKEKGK